jgi:hypothetical protein
MNLDVDYLIGVFKKNSYGGEGKEEMGEQDAAAASTGGGSSSSVPKWEDSYKTTRGKANPLMKSGEKWNTGLTRGAANQIW